jgi:hypothetical protein
MGTRHEIARKKVRRASIGAALDRAIAQWIEEHDK